jgi:hypothetical protein
LSLIVSNEDRCQPICSENLPDRLSCDNVDDWEVDDRYIVALIMKRPNSHQVAAMIEK